MTLIICGIISLTLFVASIVMAILLRKDLRKSIRVLSVGFFVLIFVAIAPCHVDESGYSFGVNLFNTICVMITQSSLTDALAAISLYDSPLVEVYRIYVICLYVLGPLTIAGATLSFVKGFGNVIYLIKSAFNDSYVFSSVNERSIAVCKSIRASHPKAVIAFALDGSDADIDDRALSQIDEAGGIIVRKNIKEIKHNLKHKRHYCLLDGNVATNIDSGLALNAKFQKNKQAAAQVELLIYSTDEMSQIIFYNTRHYVTIHLFREEEIIANDLIFNYPLYGGIVDGKLNVLIVGGGKIGYEILKKVIWSSYFGNKVQTQINVVDLHATAVASRLKKECPALFSECTPPLKFFDADVTNADFTKALDSMEKPTYIVVALGDEKINTEICIYLRRHFGITNGLPKLYMTTDTEDYADKLQLVKVSDWKVAEDRSFHQRPETEQSFEIKGFGSYESAYRSINPAESSFGILALACHVAKMNLSLHGKGGYMKEGETIGQFVDSLTYSYNQIFFTKNNADQLALSISYLLYVLGYPEKCDKYLENIRAKLNLPSVSDIPFALHVNPDYDFAKELHSNIDEISAITTERYNRFMYTMGWSNMPIEDIKNKTTRDQLRLRYARIGTYDVKALEKLMNEGAEYKKDYRKNDTDELLKLPLIIKMYNEITCGIKDTGLKKSQ